MTNVPLQGIDHALSKGCRLHAFLSGGGLRVVRLSYGSQLVGYGEAPHIDQALELCGKNYLAGATLYEHEYLTGSPETNSRLDAWMRDGGKMDCYQQDEEMVCYLSTLSSRLERVAKLGRGADFLAAVIAAINCEIG